MKYLILIAAFFLALSAHAQGVGGTAGIGGKAGLGGGPAAAGAITCVQGGAGCTHTATIGVEETSTSASEAFPVNPTSGDVIFAVIADGSGSTSEVAPTINAPTGTISSGWSCGTQINYTTNAANEENTGTVVCCVSVPSTEAITVQANVASTADIGMALYEMAGASCTQDTQASGTETSGTSPLATASYSITQNDVIFAFIVDDSNCLTVSSPETNSVTMNAGYTTGSGCSVIGFGSAYIIESAIFSSKTSQMSFTGAGTDIMQILAVAYEP